jgi:predicted nucleic acid-binding Zn finger protein
LPSPPPGLQALVVLDDKDKIQTFVACGSNRVFWQVRGTGGSTYTTTQFHCTCPAFHNSVVIANEKVYCKHQIAVILADALNILSQVRWRCRNETRCGMRSCSRPLSLSFLSDHSRGSRPRCNLARTYSASTLRLTRINPDGAAATIDAGEERAADTKSSAYRSRSFTDAACSMT